MYKVYLKDQEKLAFFKHQANSDFWDQHWDTKQFRERLIQSVNDSLFVPAVKRVLPPGSIILEGGCGGGRLVHALHYHGYRVIGLDFAQRTIARIKTAAPQLAVIGGDVRHLSIKNNALDGYVSVGVIEHFWEGYHSLLAEIGRTLKNYGYLFMSFPYMSPLRHMKKIVGGYPTAQSYDLEEEKERFYQFALNRGKVVKDLEALGFTLIDLKKYDGIKGFKDELTWFRPLLQPIYDGKKLSGINRHINAVLIPFAAHVTMLVLQKRSGKVSVN